MSQLFDPASAAPLRRQTDSGVVCLLLHGLTGAPTRDFGYLAEYLYQHGISVYAPLLSGHGKTWEELSRASAEAWQNDAVAGLTEARAMGQTVFAVGLSMGGTLALYLGERQPALAGIVTINAPVYLSDPRMRFVPAVRHFRRNVPKDPPDVADRSTVLPDLGYNSLEAVYQFERLVHMVRAGLGMITQPLLSFRSTQDHVVPPRNAEYIMEHINSASKSVITLEHSYHCATIDYDREKIAATLCRFVTTFASSNI